MALSEAKFANPFGKLLPWSNYLCLAFVSFSFFLFVGGGGGNQKQVLLKQKDKYRRSLQEALKRQHHEKVTLEDYAVACLSIQHLPLEFIGVPPPAKWTEAIYTKVQQSGLVPFQPDRHT